MEKIASLFRKIARPPIFAVAFLLVIYVVDPAWVGSIRQLLGGILTLGVLPILGYPLQKYIPHFRDKGREGQRSLAMIFCFVGYLLGTLIAVFTGAPEPLLMLYLCYLSCGITGPVFALCMYFHLYVPALIGALLTVLVFASSVKTKEHTAPQLLGGTAIAAVCISTLTVIFL